ncbi:hypothetical protein HHUSO_G21420 [Huso huso]|uniref:Uncharacterized protein n=1 Tax=Huso huso TaxID=61971 RepID=A0ABR0YYZ8_HUSHU
MINFLVWRALIQCLDAALKMDWILFRILRTLKKTLPPQQVRVLMFLSRKGILIMHTHHGYIWAPQKLSKRPPFE